MRSEEALIRRWACANAAAKRGPLPVYGFEPVKPVDEDQLKREAEAGRELMKELQ